MINALPEFYFYDVCFVPKEIFRIEENRYLPKKGIPVKYVLCHRRWGKKKRWFLAEALKFLNALSRDKDKIKAEGFIHLNTAYLWLSNGRPRLRICS